MGVRTRTTSIERTFKVLIDKRLDPEARSRRLAAVAREGLAAAQAQNAAVMGSVPAHETIVDGRPGAAEDSVAPDGIIVHEFTAALRAEVLRWLQATLRANAPALSGRFAESIAIYADGGMVDSPEAAAAPEVEEVVFVSTVAYARKLEKGRSPQAPNGVFEAAAVMAARRFGNHAAFKFTFVAPLGGDTHLERWASGRSAVGGRRRSPRRQALKDRRNPAIIVRWR